MTEYIATIDFETASEVDISVGEYRYAEDPSTHILCMAYHVTEKKLWVPGMEPPEDLLDHIELGGLVEAHNSFFEHCIWNMIAVPQYNWPNMPLKQWRCSMAKARSNGLPGALGDAGTALNLPLQKDKRGKYLIQKLSKPRRPTKKDPTKWNRDQNLLQEMYDYCKQDVDTEMCLSGILPEMPQSEIDMWLLTQEINWRGLYIDVDMVNTILSILDQVVEKYQRRLYEISGGQFKTAGQRDKIMSWCEEQNFPIPGLTKQDVEKSLERKDIPTNVKEVLEIRQILGKTSTAKYKTMIDSLGKDGRVHEVLVYHKAHTGRFGGSGVQFHNLPRPTIDIDPEVLISVLRTGDVDEVEFWFNNPFEAAACAIRSMVMAPPGKDLIAADYSAIEARVLFWLAGDEKALDIFRRGECIYCDMAASIYNTTYKRVFDGYKSDQFEETKMRKMGKDSILGLGYQMGAPKFVVTCAASGTDITEHFSEEVVAAYRKKYFLVKELWYGVEEAAIQAVRTPGLVTKYRSIKFKVEGIFLLCRLPSGRCIRYPYPSLEYVTTQWGSEKWSLRFKTMVKGQWVDEATYGGKLVENIDQAISRDLMAEALKRLAKANYPPILSVHDEAVSEIDEGYGSLKEYCDIMCQLPEWAAGLPLKASGWRGKRYRK